MCISVRRAAHARGFTLIEMIFFIVVMAVAVVGMLKIFPLASRDSADPVRRKQALMLAEAMLEEVQLAGFTYCDPTDANAGAVTTISSAGCATIVERFGQVAPEPVGTRPYDNVNDYVNANNVPVEAFGPVNLLRDANGALLDPTQTYLKGYTVTVAITPAALNGFGSASSVSADTDVLHIKVEVGYDGKTLMLDGYRLRYAPVFQ